MKVGIARYVADIAVPIALYYVLHAAGVSSLVALSAAQRSRPPQRSRT